MLFCLYFCHQTSILICLSSFLFIFCLTRIFWFNMTMDCQSKLVVYRNIVFFYFFLMWMGVRSYHRVHLIISAYRLIQECWSEKPAKRPTFRQVITRLESIHNSLAHKRRWKVYTLSLSMCVGVLGWCSCRCRWVHARTWLTVSFMFKTWLVLCRETKREERKHESLSG